MTTPFSIARCGTLTAWRTRSRTYAPPSKPSPTTPDTTNNKSATSNDEQTKEQADKHSRQWGSPIPD